MGIPKKNLYVIDTGNENCLLLSGIKHQKDKNGVWCYTMDTPLGLGIWILKTFSRIISQEIVQRLK